MITPASLAKFKSFYRSCESIYINAQNEQVVAEINPINFDDPFGVQQIAFVVSRTYIQNKSDSSYVYVITPTKLGWTKNNALIEIEFDD